MDERAWTDGPLAVGDSIDAPGVTITREAVANQSLVSGDLDAAMTALAPGAPMLGFGRMPEGPDFAIRIARDRALLVTAAPLGRSAGRQAEGFAWSDAGGLYTCLAISGPGADAALSQGLSAPAPVGSPSAMLRFAGLNALVTGRAGGLSLWVEQAHLAFGTTFLRQLGDTRTQPSVNVVP